MMLVPLMNFGDMSSSSSSGGGCIAAPPPAPQVERAPAMCGVAALDAMEGDMYLVQRRQLALGNMFVSYYDLMPRLDSCCCSGASTGEVAEGGRMGDGDGIGPLFGDLRER
jgi:hypothetical protein